MKKKICIIICVLVIISTFSIPIVSADEIDQEQTVYSWSQLIYPEDLYAQSFKPTLNTLTKVELMCNGNLKCSIRDSLTGDDLTSVTVDCNDPFQTWWEFDFDDISVVPGEPYYIVLDYVDSDYFGAWSGNGNEYPDGFFWKKEGSDWEMYNLKDFCFKTYGYHIPLYTPDNPDPQDDETGVSINTDLSWTAGGSGEGYYIIYVIYFDDEPDLTVGDTIGSIPKWNDVIEITYTNLYELDYGTTYYWKILAYYSNYVSISPEWSFTTDYSIPNKPSNPSPYDGETGVDTDIALEWTGGGTGGNEKVSYDIHLGTTTEPPCIATIKRDPDVTSLYYEVDLDPNEHYYWYIVAYTSQGSETSDLWNFYTKIKVFYNPSPYHNEEDVDLWYTNLGCKFNHPQDLSADIEFYLKGDTYYVNQLIGRLEDVEDDSWVEISLLNELDYDKTYQWTVKANDGEQIFTKKWKFFTMDHPGDLVLLEAGFEPPYDEGEATKDSTVDKTTGYMMGDIQVDGIWQSVDSIAMIAEEWEVSHICSGIMPKFIVNFNQFKIEADENWNHEEGHASIRFGYFLYKNDEPEYLQYSDLLNFYFPAESDFEWEYPKCGQNIVLDDFPNNPELFWEGDVLRLEFFFDLHLDNWDGSGNCQMIVELTLETIEPWGYLPELTIDGDIERDPIKPKPGDWVEISAYILNHGKCMYWDEIGFENKLEFQDEIFDNRIISYLDVNEALKVKWDFQWPDQDTVIFRVTADVTNVVRESNEGNNEKITKFIRSSYSVKPGTQITMELGSPVTTKPIQDIQVGDIIASYDPMAQMITSAEVVQVLEFTQDLPERVVLNGNLDATNNQTILIDESEWMYADDTQIGFIMLENPPGTPYINHVPITSKAPSSLQVYSTYDLVIRPIFGEAVGYWADGILIGGSG